MLELRQQTIKMFIEGGAEVVANLAQILNRW